MNTYAYYNKIDNFLRLSAPGHPPLPRAAFLIIPCTPWSRFLTIIVNILVTCHDYYSVFFDEKLNFLSKSLIVLFEIIIIWGWFWFQSNFQKIKIHPAMLITIYNAFLRKLISEGLVKISYNWICTFTLKTIVIQYVHDIYFSMNLFGLVWLYKYGFFNSKTMVVTYNMHWKNPKKYNRILRLRLNIDIVCECTKVIFLKSRCYDR